MHFPGALTQLRWTYHVYPWWTGNVTKTNQRQHKYLHICGDIVYVINQLYQKMIYFVNDINVDMSTEYVYLLGVLFCLVVLPQRGMPHYLIYQGPTQAGNNWFHRAWIIKHLIFINMYHMVIHDHFQLPVCLYGEPCSIRASDDIIYYRILPVRYL